MSGADPVEYAFDPRAAAEAAAAEAKREAFRAELDEQMRVKREMDDARRSGSRPRRRAPGAAPPASAAEENTYYDPGWGADLVAMGRAGVGDHVTHRDVMHGVPRRGVTSINDDYASPQRRAGGGPSSFYLGGDAFSDASLARGGDGVSFDPLRASPGANQMSQAELARRQLVADLDEQVRQKREEKRLRELREELEDAKVERRIQEVIEQERREREMKERLLIEEGGAKGGDGNVGNSPRARLEDDRDEDDRGEDDRGEGAGEGAAKPISAASLPDDHDALTPQRQLVRSPDVAARRPPADVHREDAHARRLGFGDGAETEPGVGAALCPSRRGETVHAFVGVSRAERHTSPREHSLDRKIARLQAQLEARDAELDAAKEEAARARANGTSPNASAISSNSCIAFETRWPPRARRRRRVSRRRARPRSRHRRQSRRWTRRGVRRERGASRGRGSTVVQGDGHSHPSSWIRFRSRGRAHRRRTIARRVGPRTRSQGVHRASGRTSEQGSWAGRAARRGVAEETGAGDGGGAEASGETRGSRRGREAHEGKQRRGGGEARVGGEPTQETGKQVDVNTHTIARRGQKKTRDGDETSSTSSTGELDETRATTACSSEMTDRPCGPDRSAEKANDES